MHECTNNFPVYGVLGNPVALALEIQTKCRFIQFSETNTKPLWARYATLFPTAVAEKSTREQPTGKRISFTPREMRSAVDKGSGAFR